MGKILSRELNNLESPFSHENVHNIHPCAIPEKGSFLLYFPHNFRNGSGFFVQFSKMCFLKQNWPRDQISVSYDSLTMLTTLLNPFVMIFNNNKSFMVHYLATAGLLLGHKSSFFAKNHTFE